MYALVVDNFPITCCVNQSGYISHRLLYINIWYICNGLTPDMKAYESNDNGLAAVADAALSVFTISPFWPETIPSRRPKHFSHFVAGL